MEFVRTPEARFANLDGYPFEPNYENVPDGEGGTLRIHYVDAGPHGWPTLRLSRCFRRDLGDKLATRVRKKKTSNLGTLVVGPPGLEPGTNRL